jgi:hypothetical protein
VRYKVDEVFIQWCVDFEMCQLRSAGSMVCRGDGGRSVSVAYCGRNSVSKIARKDRSVCLPLGT